MNEDKPTYDYARVKISGKLTCESDLHVGDGNLSDAEERKDAKGKPINMEGSFNTVCLDHEGKPYIPGSTLRGSLTAFLDETNETVKKLFGYENSSTDIKQGERSAGRVRVFNAYIKAPASTNAETTLVWKTTPYWDEKRHTFISHGIALDDVTGTVEKGKLFRYELVPAKTEFNVELEADHLTKDEVTMLLGLLQRWQGTSDTAIGKGTSKGYGQILWQHTETRVLTKEALKVWANSADLEKPYYADATTSIKANKTLIKNQSRHKFTISILPESPLLCNEPGFVKDKKEKEPEDPSQYFKSRNGKAIIPGPSLAGIARARGRKILMTLLHQASPQIPLNEIADKAEELIGELFGSKDRQSAIEFSDALDTAEETTKKHTQYFNAIDRFTGGVKDSAFFNVVAAQCDELKSESCYINTDRTPKKSNWWKGLLLFIARDAIEGELAVGWGKSKGYGSFTTQFIYDGKTIMNWASLLEQFDRDKAQAWIQALLDEIDKQFKTQGVAA